MTQSKDAWIKETQMFQRIARSGGEADSYEELSIHWDNDQTSRRLKKEQRLKDKKISRGHTPS